LILPVIAGLHRIGMVMRRVSRKIQEGRLSLAVAAGRYSLVGIPGLGKQLWQRNSGMVIPQRHVNFAMERFWNEDLLASEAAAKYAREFNRKTGSSKPVRFIKPIVDRCTNSCGVEFVWGLNAEFKPGEFVLIEPFIGWNYEKFNSNSGDINRNCGVSMEALSHFSYHMSNGQELLCDLQGVKTDEEYILTDPVICSVAGTYGLTDLGNAGIVAFFRNHKCTSLCNPSWRRPDVAGAPRIPAVRGTTFRI